MMPAYSCKAPELKMLAAQLFWQDDRPSECSDKKSSLAVKRRLMALWKRKKEYYDSQMSDFKMPIS